MNMLIKRWIGFFLIFAAFLIISDIISIRFQKNSMSLIFFEASENLEIHRQFHLFIKELLDQEDNKKNQLSKELLDIQYIKYNFHSIDLKNKFGMSNLPIITKPMGQNYLEVDFIPIATTELTRNSNKFILQLSLFKIAHSNKFFEAAENFEYK